MLPPVYQGKVMKRSILLAFVLAASGLFANIYGQSDQSVSKGARLWSMTCNRCHNARLPLEHNDQQWAVIAKHMRTRANLTKSETMAITRFLQASNNQRKSPSTEQKQSKTEQKKSKEASVDTLLKKAPNRLELQER